VTAKPLSEIELETVAEVMRVLGHETRLRLIDALRIRGEQSVGELEALTGIGQPGLSQQLAILRKAELVRTRRAAKQVYYDLAPTALAGTAAFMADLAGMKTSGAEPIKAIPARGSAATFAKIL